MAILSSKSTRFARSMNYTMPEYRKNTAHGSNARISVVAPLGQSRKGETTSRNGENGEG
jgi:hypothetical protein